MSHATPGDSETMRVAGLGAFIRALVPVQLTHGHVITFGVWVSVFGDDLARASDIVWQPDYAQLELQGVLANELPPWSVLGAPVNLMVRSTDQTPSCSASSDPELSRVLTEVWAHEFVLSANPL